MAKLVLLQQLGISVPEIYSSKNLEEPLVITAATAGQKNPVLFPPQCAQQPNLEPHVPCRDSETPLTPPVPFPCVLRPCLWTQSLNPRCLLAGSS